MQTADLEKPEPLRTGTVIRLMGWPWMVAFLGLLLALALAALSSLGVLAAVERGWPGVMPYLSPSVALGIALISALLALLAGPRAMAQILDDELPPGMGEGNAMMDQDLLSDLQAVLRAEKARARDATTALAGVVTLGTQMAGLVREVERRLQTMPAAPTERPGASGPDAAAAHAARELQATERRLAEAFTTTGAGLHSAVLRLADLTDRLEAGAQVDQPARIETLVTRLERWLPAQEKASLSLSEDLAGQIGRVEAMLSKADRASIVAQAILRDCSQRIEPGIVAISQLPQVVAQAETALEGRPLREITLALARELDRVQTQLDQASQKLDATGGNLAHCAASLAEGTSRARLDAATELAGLHAMVGEITERLQSARHAFGAAPAVALPVTAVGMPAGSVAASLFADLSTADIAKGQPSLARTLRRIDSAASEVVGLQAEADNLVRSLRSAIDDDLSDAMVRRAPDVLGTIDGMVRQLNSVATALALACDGPASAGP